MSTGSVLQHGLRPTSAARAARRDIEMALDAAGWPWSRRLSFWLDAMSPMLVRSTPEGRRRIAAELRRFHSWCVIEGIPWRLGRW